MSETNITVTIAIIVGIFFSFGIIFNYLIDPFLQHWKHNIQMHLYLKYRKIGMEIEHDIMRKIDDRVRNIIAMDQKKALAMIEKIAKKPTLEDVIVMNHVQNIMNKK